MRIKINLLRHSNTQFNLIWEEFKKKYSILPHEEHFCNVLKYLPKMELIDCGINDLGKEILLNNKIREEKKIAKTKVIILSPLTRVLESARIFFDTENNQKLIKIVHPSLRPTLMSLYDIPINIHQKFDFYNEFDFDFIKPDYEKYGFEWFLEDLGNSYKRKLALDFLKEKKLKKDLEKAKSLVSLMRRICPDNIENPIDVVHRMFHFKKWLKQFILDGGYKDNEVCLIGHEVMFIYFVATKFNRDCYPIKYKIPSNAEMLCINFKL